jgi:HEPN domain-containing protein
MNDNEGLFIASTLKIAAEDLQGARLLRATNNRNAFYLLEQAAEKIIRAILSSEDIAGNIRHQLADFVDLIPDANPLKTKLRDIEELAIYATTYRYATSKGKVPKSPPAEEFDRLAKKVEELLAGVSLDLAWI